MFTLITLFVLAGSSLTVDIVTDGGALVINEIMIDPVKSSSTEMGQWIELYNNSGNWVNLSEWTIVNEIGGKVQFSSLVIPPDGFFVVGASSITSENGNYAPDAVWGSFSLSLSGSLSLRGIGNDSQDFFSWNSSWNLIPGASLERLNPGWSADDPDSWKHSNTEYGEGDLGTPGYQNSVYSNGFGQNTWAFIKAFVH